MKIAVSLGLWMIACGSGSQDGERPPVATPATATTPAPVAAAPAPAPAEPTPATPAPIPAPAEPAMPAPGGLATLVQALTATGVQRIERTEGVIFTIGPQPPRTTFTWARDGRDRPDRFPQPVTRA